MTGERTNGRTDGRTDGRTNYTAHIYFISVESCRFLNGNGARPDPVRSGHTLTFSLELLSTITVLFLTPLAGPMGFSPFRFPSKITTSPLLPYFFSSLHLAPFFCILRATAAGRSLIVFILIGIKAPYTRVPPHPLKSQEERERKRNVCVCAKAINLNCTQAIAKLRYTSTVALGSCCFPYELNSFCR